MTIVFNPYINFKDNTRAAMEFYKSIFGGTLNLSTFKDGGMPHDPSEDEKIMHADFEGDNGVHFMASDTPNSMPYTEGANMGLSVSGDDEETLKGFWEKLSEGGKVTMPLDKAPWGDMFGMLTDKFGINWMVNIAGQKA